MSNRLRLTGIPTPPADDAWKAGVGYVRFDPATEKDANWGVPGYKPAFPIQGVPNATGTGLIETNGGDLYVPGDEAGNSYAGPWLRVSYELQTTAGTWHRGDYLWRAVSTGGGTIDLRTPAPELEPPTVQRPGVPATALTTADVGNTIAAQSSVTIATPPGDHPLITGAGVTAAERETSAWRATTPHTLYGSASAVLTFNGGTALAIGIPSTLPGWRLVASTWSAVVNATGLPAACGRGVGAGSAFVTNSSGQALYISLETVWARA